MPKFYLPADLHIHTIASGHAYSTLEEICRAAATKELEMIAVTDHGPAMPGGAHMYHFGNLWVLPEYIEGVRVLHGIEANVLNLEGEIDLPPNYLRKMDLVWASLHPPCIDPGDWEENTRALLSALDNPYVDGIAHPCNPDYPVDAAAVLRKAREENKLVEINNSSLFVRPGSREYSEEIAYLAKEEENLLVVNSDAHFAGAVGELDFAMEILDEAGVKKEQIINADTERVMQFVERRRMAKKAQNNKRFPHEHNSDKDNREAGSSRKNKQEAKNR